MKMINRVLKQQRAEKPSCDDEYDPYVDDLMSKTSVFNLEEWDDIDTYDDESKELMDLYKESFSITVVADGWFNENVIFGSNPDNYELRVSDKCDDYTKFVGLLRSIKSGVTRGFVKAAFDRFVADEFLDLEGYESAW